MTDLPPGEWSQLLVGHQWPTMNSLETIRQVLSSRQNIGMQFDGYAEHLHNVQVGPLANQEGSTAQHIRNSFQSGEAWARDLFEKSMNKAGAYTSAHEAMCRLRTELSEIASDGNAQIEAINASEASQASKIDLTTKVVYEARVLANSQAAKHSQALFSAIQSILDADGIGASASQFGLEGGTDLTKSWGSPVESDLREIVTRRLSQEALGASVPRRRGILWDLRDAGEAPMPTSSPMPTESTPTHLEAIARSGAVASSSDMDASCRKSPTASLSEARGSGMPVPSVDLSTATNAPATTTELPTPPSASVGQTIGYTTSGTNAAAGERMIGVRLQAASHPPNGMPTWETTSATSPLNPTPAAELAASVSNGNHAGGPLAKATEAIATASTHALHTPLVSAPAFSEANALGGVASETTYAPASISAPSMSHEPVPPVVSPALTPAVAPSVPPTMAPLAAVSPPTQGPLLAYGADLKPPNVTAHAIPPMTPAAHGAAPVSSAVTAGPGSQSPLVRQHPAADRPPAPAQAAPERALATTAAGATVGYASARNAAHDRLRRLLNSVALQQPRLRWGMGDLEDGSTLIVTDLAGGWIPPDIDIPVGVRLLRPGSRRAGLSALLRGAALTETYHPGQYLPREAQSVPTSLRARDTPAVDELGWQLSQATKWRDGLPRLAHTLARAVSARTGYLESEVELLRNCVAGVAEQVLGKYPESIDLTELGNWQLLATIEALVDGNMTLANYHFAWFRAQAPTSEASR